MASSLKTGDASSKSSMQNTTDGQNVVIQDNSATAISNTGGNTGSGSVTTGDSTAVSEMNINNGKVEGRLEVEVNGEKKELNIDKPGSYKLEASQAGSKATASAAGKSKTKENLSENILVSYWQKFLSFLAGFFKN